MHRIIAAFVALSLPGPSVAAVAKLLAFPVVAVDDTKGGVTSQMSRALFDELALLDEVSVIKGTYAPGPRVRHRQQVARERALAQLREGVDRIQKGREESARLRFKKAIVALEAGVKQLTRNIGLLEDHRLLVDAHLMLAVAHLRRGRQAAGVAAPETVVRLDPEYGLDVHRYPPLFVTMFEQTRARMLAKPRGSLRVTSEESGAQVWVNGERVGVAPLRVTDLVPGVNHVVVRLADGGSRGEAIDVQPGADVLHAARFGRRSDRELLRQAVAGNRFDEESARIGVRLGHAVRADFVAVFATDQAGELYRLSGIIGDVRSGQWGKLTLAESDVDLISVSIEAHTLSMDIGFQIGSFSRPVSGEVAVVGESPVVAPPAAAAEVASSWSSAFAPEDLMRGVPASPPVAVAVAAAAPSRSAGSAVEPVVPGVPDPQTPPTAELLVVPGLADQPPPRPSRIAAVDVSYPSVVAVTSEVAAHDSVLSRWWFWTVVGAGVAAVAGGTWAYLSLNDGNATEGLRVRAEW